MNKTLTIKELVNESDLTKLPFHSSLWQITHFEINDYKKSKPIKRYYKQITSTYEHKEK